MLQISFPLQGHRQITDASNYGGRHRNAAGDHLNLIVFVTVSYLIYDMIELVAFSIPGSVCFQRLIGNNDMYQLSITSDYLLDFMTPESG
jgi:hypothetical protein